MRWRLLLSALLLVPSFFLVAASLAGQPAAAGSEQDFGDKYLLVTYQTPRAIEMPLGGFLTKAKLRKLGDRFFLVGDAVPATGGEAAFKNARVWIALSDIRRISEFDTLDEARKALDADRRAAAGQ
jgi:hypothetical protein